MSLFDLIMVAIVAGMLAHALSDLEQMFSIVFPTLFVVLIYLGVSCLMLNNKIRKMLHMKPTVLISKGVINESGLRAVRMTVAELIGHIRTKGYFTVADVEFAIMEETGQVSVIPKPE